MPARAHERAKALDEGIEQSLAGLALPSVAQIRAYLQGQDADLGHRNNVLRILRTFSNHGLTFVSVGPSFDKGPTETHFHLESGARLSFGTVSRAPSSTSSSSTLPAGTTRGEA